MTGILPTLVSASFCWMVSSSLWIYPHSLSYFNESIGGPLNGSKHLRGSNVDWGQDLRYLRWWQSAHANSCKLVLAVEGRFDPADVGFVQGALLDPKASSTSSEKSITAMSVNFLNDARAAYDGSGGRYEDYEDVDSSAPLQQSKCNFVGYTIRLSVVPDNKQPI